MCEGEGVRGLRGKDEGLADEFALGVFGDGDSVAAGTRGAADESALGRRGPASVADVGELDFAAVGVCGGANKHAETFLEGCGFAAGDVVDVKTAVIHELALRSSVADLGNATGVGVSICVCRLAIILTYRCHSWP